MTKGSGVQQDLLYKRLRQLLAEQPGQNKRQLRKRLRVEANWPELTNTDINKTLYGRRDTFAHDGATPPRWRLTTGAQAGVVVPVIAPPRPWSYLGKEPRAWQTEALAEWIGHGRRGVVEAVTGTGKTTVGVLAAAAAVDAGEMVLVLVPGRELLDQWYEVLRRDLGGGQVGRFGDGYREWFNQHAVVVAIVNSATKYQMLPPGARGLLIADEAHRYGAEKFSGALQPSFAARLGLTATYARSDDGVAKHLEPYFGKVVAGCSYERGLADEILAPFRVAFVGTNFAPEERKEHDKHDELARTLRRRLIDDHGCPEEPFGEFMASVNQLVRGGNLDSRQTWDARNYLTAFNGRRQVLAKCRSKYEALASLAPILGEAQRGLVFSETKTSAQQAADVLQWNGVEAEDFTSDLSPAERKNRLREFKEGVIQVLAAPRILDEGIDVPQADVGVVMAGTSSKRQMIQRMGRIIRPKEGGGSATFFILYVRGTAEDPNRGAYEDFCEQIVDVAQETVFFDGETDRAKIDDWYSRGQLADWVSVLFSDR